MREIKPIIKSNEDFKNYSKKIAPPKEFEITPTGSVTEVDEKILN